MKCLYIVTNKNSFTKNSKLKITINYGVLYNLFCFIILIFKTLPCCVLYYPQFRKADIERDRNDLLRSLSYLLWIDI